MGSRVRRRGLAAVALVCHVLTSFGFPVPTAPANKKDSGRPYPCQSSPCGCLTAEACWQGDCCCLTLEQKLVWAEANGIEPPAHVRPLVESRKTRPAPRKKKPCCAEPERPEASSCCSDPAEPGGAKKPAGGVRWVAGVFAQKCRGGGAGGVVQTDPAVAPDSTPVAPDRPERPRHPAPRSDRATPTRHAPPTPPPRHV